MDQRQRLLYSEPEKSMPTNNAEPFRKQDTPNKKSIMNGQEADRKSHGQNVDKDNTLTPDNGTSRIIPTGARRPTKCTTH